MHYLFDITDTQGYLIASAAYQCSSQQEAQEKAKGDAAGDHCELVDCWEAEQAMLVLGDQLSVDEIEALAWNDYQADNAVPGACPCGDANCGGIEWILNGNDPFERIF